MALCCAMEETQRLSEAMERQRLRLRLQWKQVAERAGLSQAGLGAIRRGDRTPSALTRARIEHALGWAAGSVDSLLAGGEPVDLAEGSGSGSSLDELRRLIGETEDELRWLNPKYESNRASLAAHLERRLAELRRQLEVLQNKG